MSADGWHITAPDEQGRGAARAMKRCLADAAAPPHVVDYINAHGTSTPLGDLAETIAMKHVFEDHARRLQISSTKSQLGHLLGASGGVELIASALAIETGVLPPTINLEEPGPGCDLDYIPNVAREARGQLRDVQQLRLRRAQRQLADQPLLPRRQSLNQLRLTAKAEKAPRTHHLTSVLQVEVELAQARVADFHLQNAVLVVPGRDLSSLLRRNRIHVYLEDPGFGLLSRTANLNFISTGYQADPSSKSCTRRLQPSSRRHGAAPRRSSR